MPTPPEAAARRAAALRDRSDDTLRSSDATVGRALHSDVQGRTETRMRWYTPEPARKRDEPS